MTRFGILYRQQAAVMRSAGMHVTSACRCAARYAALVRCSIHDAAQAFGVSAGGAWNAWSRIYPGVPHPVAPSRRSPACAACGGRGHLAVRGKCSPSELALRMLTGGARVRDAAHATGLTTAAVYAALDQRRRAA